MSEIATDITVLIVERLRSAVSPECYQTWFKEIHFVSCAENTVRINVPNRYVKFWLESHYRKEIMRAINCVLPEVRTLEIGVPVTPRPGESAATLSAVLERSVSAQKANRSEPPVLTRGNAPQQSSGSRDTVRLTPLSPKLRLESFLVGKSNRIAHSAAQTVAESPGIVYNPLYLYGAHGLGKTHLLQGIAHLMLEKNPPANVLHISCEEFTNAYISAVQNKRLDAFRARFRSCDALLIDDVQFLGGRERTQEEFLHTFDTLRDNHKQIVLCADTAPREIRKLDQKLATRFVSGLVTHLRGPDLPLRMEVLREKARSRGLALAPDVTELLATHIESNVRELEGAVCKLLALAAAENSRGESPNRELAILALRELGYLRSGPLSLQDILDAVSQRFGVSADDLRSSKRYAAITHARHIGMYLSKTLTSQSVADIGRFYGNRDHATVLHAARKMGELIKRDENVKNEVQSLRQVLGR
ncbi:MAG TPA: chromosomal replication initiator protein DnaA [Planctomycetota bacterium]|nr:chromosomal replication initiator protein DnaA [Planctomycetota bacterium]